MNYETYQHIECQVKTHIYLLRLLFLIFYNCTKYHTLTCNYDYVTSDWCLVGMCSAQVTSVH